MSSVSLRLYKQTNISTNPNAKLAIQPKNTTLSKLFTDMYESSNNFPNLHKINAVKLTSLALEKFPV